MRDNRIKELILGDGGDWSGANTFVADAPSYTAFSKSINGEILSVDLRFNQNGSVGIAISGIGAEFYRNNASSGASWSHRQPREFSQSTTGSIASALHVPFVVNGPIVLTTGSLTSGTAAILDCIVKYR